MRARSSRALRLVALLAVLALIASAATAAVDHGNRVSTPPAPAWSADNFSLNPARLPYETREEIRTQLVLEARTAESARPELNAFASRIAGRAVEVGCAMGEADWKWHRYFVGKASGYAVAPGRGFIVWLAPHACRGARAVAGGDEGHPARLRALGVLVLTHEALHLRHWTGAASEAATECAAIRRFERSVLELGGNPDEAAELLPWALAIHWWLARQSGEYRKKSCRLPSLI
jgi:hypothetical protein